MMAYVEVKYYAFLALSKENKKKSERIWLRQILLWLKVNLYLECTLTNLQSDSFIIFLFLAQDFRQQTHSISISLVLG